MLIFDCDCEEGGSSAVIQSINITPSTSAQTITASGGVDGYSPLNVSAVTNSIDANIAAGNIKKDITILGVTGSYEGTVPSGTLPIGNNGVYDVTNYASADVSVIDEKYGVSLDNLLGTPVDGELGTGSDTDGDIIFNGVGVVTDFALCYFMANRYNFTHNVSFPDLVSIEGENSMAYAFYKCQNMGSISFPSLINITGDSVLANAFRKCPFTTFTFPELKYITGTTSVLSSAFLDCTSLTTVSFPKVEILTCPQGMSTCFQNCTSLEDVYFDSLTIDSFGTITNQFSNMLRGCSGVKLHFPDGLQGVISGLSGFPNFGGTSTSVLFDL